MQNEITSIPFGNRDGKTECNLENATLDSFKLSKPKFSKPPYQKADICMLNLARSLHSCHKDSS